jgi:capsular exopolysaccharide synthesis family protein
MLTGVKRRAEQKEKRTDDLSSRLTTLVDPNGPAAEAYRVLRAGLMYAGGESAPKVIAVTSPGPREGKSTVCANLGVALAQVNANTLVVDANLRSPVVHRVFGVANGRGLADVLSGDSFLQEALHESMPGLTVIPAGASSLHPADLVDPRRFADFLHRAGQRFEYVLVDTPPLESASEALVLAAQADGVLLVFDAQNTRKEAVEQAARGLQASGSRVLGTVMNNAKNS